MDQKDNLDEYLYHLSRLGLSGRPQDVQKYLRRVVRKLDGELSHKIGDLLASSPSLSSPLRDAGVSISPIDKDSRLPLIRVEHPGEIVEKPILSQAINETFNQVILEGANRAKLEKKGVMPTRSMVFSGPPGVGKTMSARWIAHEMQRPLLILDLSTVMSSYLGKTGANLRAVLDHAKSTETVLLLDEFDAIAKRRDDDTEIGELKRLVTVLLQEIDDWPPTSLLIAATNHANLLDPAAWRRFDEIVEFALPDDKLRQEIIHHFSQQNDPEFEPWVSVLANIWSERSPSDIERLMTTCLRRSIINDSVLIDILIPMAKQDIKNATGDTKREISSILRNYGYSKRKIADTTGISRNTQ